MAQEELQLWQSTPPIEFHPRLSARTEVQSLLILARQNPGFAVAGGQLGHAVHSHATQVLFDFSKTACAIRYQVDGSWEQLPPLDRETGDAMLYALKQLCQLNPADRRSAQTGKCDLKRAKDKYFLTLQSQGTATGERVLVRIDAEKLPFERMSDLGMRDKMYAAFKQHLDSEGNIILFSAPKGHGLTTTWAIGVDSADRYVRDFQSFEEKENPEPDAINIKKNFYGSGTDLTLAEAVKKAILKEPDVLLFPNLPDPESMQAAVVQVESTDKQIYTRIVADGAVQAIAQLVAQYRNCAADIAKHVGAVLGQRLVRRLCDNCKVGFDPSPQLLKQLGIPVGRVAVLYQPFVPPPIEQQVDENGRPAPITPCHVCNGRGYFGRIAIFELLTPDERFRATLPKLADVNQLTQIAKAEGFRGLQSEAILTVLRGLTSLEELKRAFAKKQ